MQSKHAPHKKKSALGKHTPFINRDVFKVEIDQLETANKVQMK